MKQDAPLCDIVIPVCNNLAYVKDCISAILQTSSTCVYHLYMVDDCSDSVTTCFLQQQIYLHPHVFLHRNPVPLGFFRSFLIGAAFGSAPYVVLMRSKVIVTPEWLLRLLKCAESDARIAAVTPFSNEASAVSIPLAPGANFYGMDRILTQHAARSYPDVQTDASFCLLLRRAALLEVGMLDGNERQDDCTEFDLSVRLARKGYRTVIADDVYVYHRGDALCVKREDLQPKNGTGSVERGSNGKLLHEQAITAAPVLEPTRDLFRAPQRWAPLASLRGNTYRQIQRCWEQRDLIGVTKLVLRGVYRLPTAKRPLVSSESVARMTRPGRLRVTYVLRSLSVGGGTLSVIQLVNELILLGVEARIVALRDYPEIYDWKFFTQPIVFPTVSELCENFPQSDIAVATLWITAPWVAEVMKAGRAHTGAYFIQDYESWFFPETDQLSRAKVLETYKLIPHKIVKSAWLSSLLAHDGIEAHKIRLGMDLAMFYPRSVAKSAHPVVLAMTRPQTPRRGFPYLIEALRLVKEARPEVEVVVFGDALSSRRIPFPHRNEGVVTDQHRLAQLYSAADVFLDGSTFQGFGRPALEAMACGAACVLTNVGGVNEYARHEDNCLLVPPQDPRAFADAILRLLQDGRLKQKLIEGGLKTARNYCHKREAQETLAYFRHIVPWQGDEDREQISTVSGILR